MENNDNNSDDAILKMPSIYSREDYLQLYQLEQLNDKLTTEILNGCVFVVTDSVVEGEFKSAKAYIIATKENKTSITKEELSVLTNSITLLHLDDWLFDSKDNNTRHIRLVGIGDSVHFQAMEAGKEGFALDIAGKKVDIVLWATFIKYLGNSAAVACREYEEYAKEWRKNQA